MEHTELPSNNKFLWGDLMGLALVKEREINGVYREDFEFGLLQLGDMARIAEQRLTLKADHSIEEHYQKEKREIEDMGNLLESIRVSKDNSSI